MPHLANAHCLDLFAGSGALGMEALSREASFVQFVEEHHAASVSLSENLQSLNAEASEYSVHCGDAIRYLHSLSTNSGAQKTRPFDIVFLDPPFERDLWQQSVDLLAASPMVSSDALIYVESPRETKAKIPQNWRTHRSLNAGSINATLYRLDPASEETQPA